MMRFLHESLQTDNPDYEVVLAGDFSVDPIKKYVLALTFIKVYALMYTAYIVIPNVAYILKCKQLVS